MVDLRWGGGRGTVRDLIWTSCVPIGVKTENGSTSILDTKIFTALSINTKTPQSPQGEVGPVSGEEKWVSLRLPTLGFSDDTVWGGLEKEHRDFLKVGLYRQEKGINWSVKDLLLDFRREGQVPVESHRYRYYIDLISVHYKIVDLIYRSFGA